MYQGTELMLFGTSTHIGPLIHARDVRGAQPQYYKLIILGVSPIADRPVFEYLSAIHAVATS